VLAGTTLVFILSIGFYITPALLGGGRVLMIAVLIEEADPRVPQLGIRRRCRWCCSRRR
jgi:ABC-type spermidine/putrescine transport system permease subunit I